MDRSWPGACRKPSLEDFWKASSLLCQILRNPFKLHVRPIRFVSVILFELLNVSKSLKRSTESDVDFIELSHDCWEGPELVEVSISSLLLREIDSEV